MYRILLIDDQRDMQKLVAHHLTTHLGAPFDLSVACDEGEALASVAASVDYDIVLLDLCLPEFTGLDLMGKLLLQRPDLAVVVVSGQGSEQIVVEALERGAMSYVDKSNLAKVLCPTVRKVVAASRASELRRQISSGMTSAQFEYELDNDPGLIPALLDEVREVFAKFSIGGANPAQMLIGIEEALSNALYHGNLEIGSELKHVDFNAFYRLAQSTRLNEPYRDRRVRLTLDVSPGNARVTVGDDGNGFDPASVPDPTLPENADKAYGRGLLLMRAFFDDVHFNERGNEVTLVASSMPAGQYVDPKGSAGEKKTKSTAA